MENKSQIVIYKDKNNNVKIDVRFDGDTVWLTQKFLADLFQTTVPNINMHIKHIFKEGELSENRTIKNYLIVQNEGGRQVKRGVEYYNLEMIIALGYRVNSTAATHFRIWTTVRLSEFIVKGFVVDAERLKNPDLPFDYFEELERTIADIRTSEKRFYRKITDIYATSTDYDPTSEQSLKFFKTVQNKVHYAITGNTAAEVIVSRIDSKKKNLGLTTFRGKVPTKDEVSIAKNYYNKEELTALNALVEQYLIFATEQARRKLPMRMKDWIEKLNGFLKINDRDILEDAGKISHELMLEITDKKYQECKEAQSKQDLDFDPGILEILDSANKNDFKLNQVKKIKNKTK
jgi:hypothetical protein